MPKQISDEQVFAAVLRLVIERGYNGATTRALADAAGMSEVTLFRKYGSKANLVLAALKNQAAISTMTQIRYSGDLHRDLLEIVTLYLAAAETQGSFFASILAELPRHDELHGALDYPMMIMEGIGAIMTRYQAEGQLRPEPPLHSVAALLGPLITMTLIRQATAGRAMPPIDLEAHVKHFLNGRQCQ